MQLSKFVQLAYAVSKLGTIRFCQCKIGGHYINVYILYGTRDLATNMGMILYKFDNLRIEALNVDNSLL